MNYLRLEELNKFSILWKDGFENKNYHLKLLCSEAIGDLLPWIPVS